MQKHLIQTLTNILFLVVILTSCQQSNPINTESEHENIQDNTVQKKSNKLKEIDIQGFFTDDSELNTNQPKEWSLEWYPLDSLDIHGTNINSGDKTNFENYSDPAYNKFLKAINETRTINKEDNWFRWTISVSLGGQFSCYGVTLLEDGDGVFYKKEGGTNAYKGKARELYGYRSGWKKMLQVLEEEKVFEQKMRFNPDALDSAAEIWQLDVCVNGQLHSIIKSYEELEEDYELFKAIKCEFPFSFDHNGRFPWLDK